MGEKLALPPLIESLCEFKFDPSDSWDWTLPGRLYDLIGEEFSDRSQVDAVGLQIEISAGKPSAQQAPVGPERVQLKRSDGSAMVQVGPHLLAMNQLRPYPSWEAFRAMILNIFEKYTSLQEQYKLVRIGLRYINRISLPEDPCNLGNIITLDPPLHGVLDRELIGFYQRYELMQTTPKGILIHQTGIPKSDEALSLMIDLDFSSQEVIDISGTNALSSWLDQAHDRIYEAFVASLTSNYYEQLQKGEA